MSILYRPVLIESAEQAEALPVGTIAILREGTRIRQTLTKTDSLLGPWEMNMRGYRHELVVGFTTLVPIEAEVDHIYGSRATIKNPGPPVRSRLVTPWETSSPSPDRRGGCA